MPTDSRTLYQRPAELLQTLLRFDTRNPPGDESACAAFIYKLLQDAGCEPQIYAKQAHRPNVVARLPGAGKAPPLLLQGHIDVVGVQNQTWQHPPFGGDIVDGVLWGRGTLDMKGAVTMMLTAFLRAQAEGLELPGDVILTVLADEETGGDVGAHFLVDEHPALFEGVRYAIGEFGGFTQHMAGTRFYPIMVAEKQGAWLKATFHGPAGHGSTPIRGGAMAKLGRFLRALDAQRLPVHLTPVPQQMIEQMAAALPAPLGAQFSQLLDPTRTDAVLDTLGALGNTLDAALHNTVSPTMLQGSGQLNVIPAAVSVELDCRLLPGCTPHQAIAEIKQVTGDDAEYEVKRYDIGPTRVDMGLYDTLADILRQADPGGVPVPMLLTAATDGRIFAHLGIQTYGFTPLTLPPDLAFTQTIHAADERVPVAALEFGCAALYEVLKRF